MLDTRLNRLTNLTPVGITPDLFTRSIPFNRVANTLTFSRLTYVTLIPLSCERLTKARAE